MQLPYPSPLEPSDRIVEVAGEQLLREGYHGFQMDRLAAALGMSKKTLYVHFPGKDAILDAFVERFTSGMHGRIEAAAAQDGSFAVRLDAVMEVVSVGLARVPASLFSDLQRYAPPVFRRIDELRSRLIPRVFGQLIRDGVKEGHVRADVDPDFAAFAWLQLVRGLTQPEALERTGLTPRQTLREAFRLFWQGILTPSGCRAVRALGRDGGGASS